MAAQDLDVHVVIRYDSWQEFPLAGLWYAGRDVTGIMAEQGEAVTLHFENRTADGRPSLRVTALGQDEDIQGPVSVPWLEPDERTLYEPVIDLHLGDWLAEGQDWILEGAASGPCRSLVISAGAGRTAGFDVWANATARFNLRLDVGPAEDTFLRTNQDFERTAGVIARDVPAPGGVAHGMQLAMEIGDSGDAAVVLYEPRGPTGYTVESQEAYFVRPDGTRYDTWGLAIDAYTGGGEWDFYMSPSTFDSSMPTIWGAVLRDRPEPAA